MSRHQAVAFVVLALAGAVGLWVVQQSADDALRESQMTACQRGNVQRNVLGDFIAQTIVARRAEGDNATAAGYAQLYDRLQASVSRYASAPGSLIVNCDEAVPN